jgi:hypothetical protein
MKRGETAIIAELNPHPMNYNQHPDDQVAALRRSLKRFGQVRDIVTWQRFVVAGHGVLEAARAEGWKTISATRLPEDWEEEQVLAYLAADNETARMSRPDDAQLVALLGAVTDDELRALAAGGEERLRELLEPPAPTPEPGDAEPQTDRAEELRQEWGVEPGQMWRLPSRTPGQEHRLICGDCADAAVVERVMGGEKATLLWADPPFGISYTGHGASKDGRANKFAPIIGDDAPDPSWLPMWLPKHGAVYLKTTWQVLRAWESAIDGACRLRARIVWDRCSHSAGEVVGGYATQTEIVLFGSVGEHKTNRFDTDLWSIPRATTGAPEQRTGHPYESPVALPQRAIANSSQVGDIIADPFCGSGTGVIAAENLARQCRAVEISPAYVAVALQRYRDAFGIEPELMTGDST